MTRDENTGVSEYLNPGHREIVQLLLEQGGLAGGEFAMQPLPGGGNNRVYRLTTPAGQSALLKAYFRHPDDTRDRLKAEYDFTCFAWQHGVRCVPRPLACDPQAGLGLYEFVEGRRLRTEEVDEAAVEQALVFYQELNRHRQTPEAMKLPAGSEACFCLADHLACVERRLARCETWQPRSPLDAEALAFVHHKVLPLWWQVRANVEKEGEKRRKGEGEKNSVPFTLSPLLPFSPSGFTRLSPSDFGFHNALLEASGKLRFVDFEYAGWDDPAKLVCDFFCQPALPAPARCWPTFLAQVMADLPEPAEHCRRAELLLPVYRVKWITIMLNDFQPTGDDRRRFARPGQDPEQRKAEQLEKARVSLHSLTDVS